LPEPKIFNDRIEDECGPRGNLNAPKTAIGSRAVPTAGTLLDSGKPLLAEGSNGPE